MDNFVLLGSSAMLSAQATIKIPKVYQPVKKSMYHKGWIDFNKNGVMDVYENPDAKIEDRIEDLLGQMNIKEKTCQMVTLYGYKRVLKDALPTPEWKNMLWKDGIGAIDEHLNGFQQWGLPPSDNENVWPASRHAWALNEVQRFFVEDTRLGIPVDFTNEGIRGVESYRATNFPTQLGLGHTWNRDLIYKVGRITGREGRMLGYTNVYAPILDVGRDQRWGRYEEVYGESPYLVAELGIEMVKGMQYNHQVAATGKHFIAYSNNKGAREGMARVDPQMSPREVEMVHVYPFRRVIKEAGLLGVMSSYNDYDGFPIQSSSYWLTTRLRGEWGFRGYVVSDSDAVEYLYTKHGTAKDMKGVNGPLYPFGYGLSYTTFEYSDLQVSPKVITPNQKVTVTCKVTNTGKRAGDEVVQLYLRDVVSSLTTYEKNLVGFERFHLKPGETKEVRFMLDRKDMELLNAKNDWVVEPGEFRVMAGASSEDIRLSDKFAVVEYGMNGVWSETGNSKGDAISASTEMQDVGMTLDNDLKTCWQGNKGDYITFALENGAKIDGLSIAWKKENTGEADFEIQLSGGGGQFLTVYSGSVSKFNEWMSYTFKGTTASDLRILLNSDGLGVAEVKINQLKKE